MKRKMSALLFAALTTAAAFALSVTGCGSSTSSASSDSANDNVAADVATEAEAEVTVEDAATSDAGGFQENPIFEDEELEFINLSAVWFQAVPMAPGQEDISAFDIHLEADISALENDLGYGVGDWIPYLTVDYEVVDEASGETAASGTFMTMSASDGPHYGANIALPDAGTYDLTITIHNPAENGYLIHSDSETGPGGVLDDYFADGNLSYTYTGWDYLPLED
jgi:uncharacterized protein involved in high-affinity Fe2+ transport